MEFRRILLDGYPTEVVLDGDSLVARDGRRVEARAATHLPPVSPTKIICCHLNHISRVREFGVTLTPGTDAYFPQADPGHERARRRRGPSLKLSLSELRSPRSRS